jgi:hypothetical protein
MMSAEPLLGLLDLTENVLFGLRIAAGLGGALLGWIVSNPVLRLGHRIIAGRPVPGWAVPWVRLLSAGVLGVLAYFFIPLGGGGGLGWGPGRGGGPGKGPGEGGAYTKAESGSTSKEAAASKAKSGREVLDIELLGGPRYTGDGRYYLLQRQAPPLSLEEVEEALKKRGDRVEVHVILTEQSVGRHHEAVARLRALLDRLKIPTVEIEATPKGPATDQNTG